MLSANGAIGAFMQPRIFHLRPEVSTLRWPNIGQHLAKLVSLTELEKGGNGMTPSRRFVFSDKGRLAEKQETPLSQNFQRDS